MVQDGIILSNVLLTEDTYRMELPVILPMRNPDNSSR